MKGPVLVLGAEPRSCLAVVRSLGRARIPVHIADVGADSPIAASRYVARRIDLPVVPSGEGSEDWALALEEHLRRERYDLIVPCTDESLLPLDLHRDRLERLATLALPSRPSLRIGMDKIESVRLAARASVPLPAYRVAQVGRLEDGERPDWPFPWVLKPRASFGRDWRRKRPVQTVHDHPEWMDALAEFERDEEILVMAWVPGRGVGVEVLAHEGQVSTWFQHLRLHEPAGGGGSSLRAAVPVDPRLKKATEAMVAELNYTGVVMFEYRVHGPDFIFVEINTRFWGSLPLAVAAGVDFPLRLYEQARSGRPPGPAPTPRLGLRSRNLIRDVGWVVREGRRSGRLLSSTASLLDPRIPQDTLQWDDPGPAWVEARSAARQAAVKLRRPVRRDRPLQLTPGSKGLVVCKGNVCRSPFAVALLDRLRPDLGVAGRGHRTRDGRRCPWRARRTAAAFGLDLEGHRSRQVTAKDLREAEWILVFDRFDQAALEEARDRVWLIGDAAGLQPVEIADPVGGPVEMHRQTYLRIEQALTRLCHT